MNKPTRAPDFTVDGREFFVNEGVYRKSDTWRYFKIVNDVIFYKDENKTCWDDVDAFYNDYKNKQKETKQMSGEFKKSFQSFITAHGNTLFFIALVIVLDHYLFDGALRERLKKTTEGLLDQLPGGNK